MSYGHVVLADSHSNMLEGMRRIVETMAESVIMVADEPSLIHAIHKMEPDLVIVDFSFRVSGDTSVARLIKRHHPAIKMIVVSVYEDLAVVKEATDAGAEGFVLKRRAVVDLVPAIQQVFQGQQFVSTDRLSNNEEDYA